MGAWDWIGAVVTEFAAAPDLYVGAGPQIAHPARVTAMEPRNSAIIYDPEATLEPLTVCLLGAQDDHVPSDLDQRPVGEHVSYAKANHRGEDDGESLHGMMIPEITGATAHSEGACEDQGR